MISAVFFPPWFTLGEVGITGSRRAVPKQNDRALSDKVPELKNRVASILLSQPSQARTPGTGVQHNTGFLTPAVREATHPKPQTKGRSLGIWRKKVTFRRNVNEAESLRAELTCM